MPTKTPEWIEVGQENKSVDSSIRSERRMRMCYTYLRIEQLFSIGEVPDCFVYPLHLLVKIRQTNDTDTWVLNPPELYNDMYTEIVEGLEY
jgi:hypothetical protein